MRNPNRWEPLVEREESKDDGIEFVLTPRERDVAKLAAIHLEANRRRLNRMDTAQSLADALVREGLA